MSTVSKPRVFVLNGPNLNLLGQREPAAYGTQNYEDLVELVTRNANDLGINVDVKQTNHEGLLIDWIHEAKAAANGIILNPASLTHTSIGVRDAVLAANLPTIEVHISNVHAREEFRHHSFVSSVATTVIVGAGIFGYVLALQNLSHILNQGVAA